MAMLEQALDLLGKMVAIPSVEGREGPMGDFLAEYTRAMGMEAELQEVEPGRSNVIARVRVGQGGKTVVLNSHMDVVPPADGWSTDPWVLVVKGGKAYGRGSTDAKGALCCFLMAVRAIMEAPGDTHGNIIFTAVVDEETCSKGARHLAASGAVQGDYGIVGEPTMSGVFICHKGSVRPVIKVLGKTAHASTPELGISAVSVAGCISQLVEEMHAGLRRVKHPIAGSPSAVITLLKAGVKENVLPDTCEVVIDRRMVPGEDEDAIKASFDALCKKAEERFPGARVWVDGYLVTTGPASESKPGSPIVKTACAACEAVTGIVQHPAGADCNTDMNHLVGIGIPCVIIGPGTLDVAHMPNEYVELAQLEACIKVYEAVIRALLGS